jgi:hypothetical protein
MKKIVIIIIIAFGFFETIIAQETQLPLRISISDKLFSPGEADLFYKYELELKGDYYSVQRTALIENGKKKKRKKQVGKVDIQLIRQILLEIKLNQTREIQVTNFQYAFPLDSINNFFKESAKTYWINNEYQKQFIIEQLTEPERLKSNLESYYKYNDQYGYIDDRLTDVEIIFHFADSMYKLSSKSILWFGLPIEINGEINYSPKLASLIGNLIPESKTERKNQFSGIQIFSEVLIKTINNHYGIINGLETKTYQEFIDSLDDVFEISHTRIINGTYSINWNGEKRLSCLLRDTSKAENIFISYSTSIENGKVRYPVSLIINDYPKLIEQVMNVSFFRNYLKESPNRHLTINYDDYSCFTEKSRQSALKKCSLSDLNIDFENAVFISLTNEGNSSIWAILPNGQYFLWWFNGEPPIPYNDNSYLKCE